MTPRALACAAAVLLLAACRGTGRAAGEHEVAPGPQPAPRVGPDIAAEVGGRFAPSLEALQGAVTAGEDELARALIAHVDSLGPDDRVWQLTRAFERILDGRAAVRTLELSLACEPEPLETLFPGAEKGAQAWRLLFRARNRGADAIELRPGPATLSSTRTDLGRNGGESNLQETRSFDKLRKFTLAGGAQAEVELARFFLDPAQGLLAVRLSFELELRSGVIERDGRELPAMRLVVAPARAVRRAADLPADSLTPAQLLSASAGLTEPEELLALAVRTELGEGEAGLRELQTALAELARPRLELWLPALRWLAGPDVPKDVELLRHWLRGSSSTAPRPALVLPREGRAEPPPGN